MWGVGTQPENRFVFDVIVIVVIPGLNATFHSVIFEDQIMLIEKRAMRWW